MCPDLVEEGGYFKTLGCYWEAPVGSETTKLHVPRRGGVKVHVCCLVGDCRGERWPLNILDFLLARPSVAPEVFPGLGMARQWGWDDSGGVTLGDGRMLKCQWGGGRTYCLPPVNLLYTCYLTQVGHVIMSWIPVYTSLHTLYFTLFQTWSYSKLPCSKFLVSNLPIWSRSNVPYSELSSVPMSSSNLSYCPTCRRPLQGRERSTLCISVTCLQSFQAQGSRREGVPHPRSQPSSPYMSCGASPAALACWSSSCSSVPTRRRARPGHNRSTIRCKVREEGREAVYTWGN